MEDIDFIGSIPETGFLRYVKIPEIIKSVKKTFVNWFSRTRRIVVYGESGAGKTQFLRSILDIESFDDQRTQSIVEYPIELSDGHKVVFIDTPGNQSLDYIRQQLSSRYAHKEISGVINVVANGYQSVPNTNLTQVFNVDTNEVKQQYLDNNKARELRQLEEWKGYVTSRNGVKWFITIVNKADIWYVDRDIIMEYYHAGEYHNAIKELLNVCEVMSFPYCSLIAPFFDRQMPLVMSQKEQIIMHREFKKKLIDLIIKNG